MLWHAEISKFMVLNNQLIMQNLNKINQGQGSAYYKAKAKATKFCLETKAKD